MRRSLTRSQSVPFPGVPLMAENFEGRAGNFSPIPRESNQRLARSKKYIIETEYCTDVSNARMQMFGLFLIEKNVKYTPVLFEV